MFSSCRIRLVLTRRLRGLDSGRYVEAALVGFPFPREDVDDLPVVPAADKSSGAMALRDDDDDDGL